MASENLYWHTDSYKLHNYILNVMMLLKVKCAFALGKVTADKSTGLYQSMDATSTPLLANFRRDFQTFTLNEQQLHAG